MGLRLAFSHREPALPNDTLKCFYPLLSSSVVLQSHLLAASHLIPRPNWRRVSWCWPGRRLQMCLLCCVRLGVRAAATLDSVFLFIHFLNSIYLLMASYVLVARWGYEDIFTSLELNILFSQEILINQ